MADIEDIKTDPQIANILQRLKNTSKSVVKKKDDDLSSSYKDNQSLSNEKPSYAISAKEIPVAKSSDSIPKKEVAVDANKDATSIEKKTEEVVTFTDEDILPWFSKSDKDLNFIHYIKFNESCNIEYDKVKNDISPEDLAALKLKSDYVCDIDYYKSNHYILCVKNIDSNYSASRSFSPSDDDRTVVKESLDDDMRKLDSDRLSSLVVDTDRYFHYVVVTDLGVADFLVRQDDVPYPYGESDLNKWFEEVSNHVQIINPRFEKNSLLVSEESEKIRDFKYDIITMHRPGVIVLDSVDNSDSSYQLHIKLKDEFSFLPMNRVLGCLKFYATSKKKTVGDFRKFIDRYFDVTA